MALASSIHLVTLLKLVLPSQKIILMVNSQKGKQNLVKCILTGDVVNDHSNRGVLDVGRDEASEPFLACGVPKLQSDHFVIHIHGLGQEVDANGSLKYV